MTPFSQELESPEFPGRFSGMASIAQQADLNPTQLYRMLSKEGNPTLSSFSAILREMGLRLAVQPAQV